MGQCLKDAYAERDLAKALVEAHGLIDEQTRYLSDKLHNLKLSHNRKRKALEKILKILKSRKVFVVKVPKVIPDLSKCDVDWDYYYNLIEDICERALFSDGRFDIR